MTGEQIFGLIIMVGSCWLCAAVFCVIAFWGTKQKEPMHFWTGTTVDPKTISDIPAYNRANARMWYVYSSFYWLAGIIAFVHTLAAVAVLVLACIPGIFFLIKWYNRILNKYKVL